MEVKIKDYIIDIDKEVNKVTKVKVKPKVEYALILENDMDFIIRRKSARQEKDLVFLVSQDLFYIKDNKTQEIKKIDKSNCRKLVGSFKKDMDRDITFSKVTWTVNSNINKLCDLLSSESRRVVLREGFGVKSDYETRLITPFISQNKKLLKYYYERFKSFGDIDLLKAVFLLEETRDYNNAKYLIDKFADDYRFSRKGNIYDMIQLMNRYECDATTFIDYMTNGLYTQGIDGVSWSIVVEYRDYLSMSHNMFGKVKNKYPKHLKTEHDRLTLKYNLWSKYKNDLGAFNITEQHRKLEYKNKDYSIIIPETSMDIISEGVNQSNCVASYVKNIKEGKTFVCFMRRNSDLDRSYVTIEVKDGNTVSQYLGFANRKLIEEEMRFIREWCKKKDLILL